MARRAAAKNPLAQASAELANKRLRMARSAVDDYVRKIANDPNLATFGDLFPLRRDLLASVRGFYDEFVKQEGDDEELQFERGKAYTQLAFIVAEIESREAAESYHEEAEGIFRRLQKRDPGNLEYRRSLQSSLLNLSQHRRELGRHDEAIRDAEEALAISRHIAKQPEANAADNWLLADSERLLGQAWDVKYVDDKAETHYRQAIDMLQKLRRRAPELDRARFALAAATNNLGLVLNRSGNPDKFPAARAEFQKSVELLRPRAGQGRTPSFANDLANSLENWAGVDHNWETAKAPCSFTMRRPNCAPKWPETFPTSNSSSNTARRASVSGPNCWRIWRNSTKRAETFTEVISIWRRMAKESDGEANILDQLCGALYNACHLGYAATKVAERRPRCAKPSKTGNGCGPNCRTCRSTCSIRWSRTAFSAESKRAGGSKEAAEQAYDRALVLGNELMDRQPDHLRYPVDVAGVSCNRAILKIDLGKPDEALAGCDRGIELLERLLEGQPNIRRARLFLRNNWHVKALALRKLQRFGESAAAWSEVARLDQPPSRYHVRADIVIDSLKAGQWQDAEKVMTVPLC